MQQIESLLGALVDKQEKGKLEDTTIDLQLNRQTPAFITTGAKMPWREGFNISLDL